MDAIIHRALCSFRETEAKRAQEYITRGMAAEKGSARRAAMQVEAAKCARSSNEAHAALGLDFVNPCQVWDEEYIEMVIRTYSERAEDHWNELESIIEGKAAADFEDRAYGRD
jgi:hypothetical protein